MSSNFFELLLNHVANSNYAIIECSRCLRLIEFVQAIILWYIKPTNSFLSDILRIITVYQICFIIPTLSFPCSYKVPNIDDIVFDVPVDGQNVYRQNLSTGKSRSKREIIDETHKPLRIHLYYDTSSIDKLTPEMQSFINQSLLPEAVGFWEQVLAVRRTKKPIRLTRKCTINHYYIHGDQDLRSCALGCKELTNCGEVIIPDQHLYQCKYCTSSKADNCIFSGPEDGKGVENSDFLLYVSAVPSKRCDSVDTVAYAAHCQQEAILDRPIAGHVNLCPNTLSTCAHDHEVLISTVKHEILHALGFSAGLYGFFRNKDGSPRTKRNRHNKPLSLNREKGYYDWDENTIKTVMRNDWWTTSGYVPHLVHTMVTPRVKEEAQRHFGCDSLEGAELENQGGEGTSLTHWEKRLFENEAMTGTHTQNPVYSRLTLALLEDSGWYQPNYRMAENLSWGRGLGCQFAKKSCAEWIRKRQNDGLSIAPFCNEIKHDGHKSLAVTRCTAQRDSLTLCNLTPYQKALPTEYQIFDELNGAISDQLKFYGGSVELADFCPYSQEFEWKISNTSERRDSRCELEENHIKDEKNSIFEVYGANSKCFDLATTWTYKKCGRIRTFRQYMAGCYQYSCMDGKLFVGIYNESQLYPCHYAGQLIHVKKIVGGWLREGKIICPNCDEICNSQTLTQNNTSKYCHDSIEMSSEYIGDDPLNEPCKASYLQPLTLSSAIFIVFLVNLSIN